MADTVFYSSLMTETNTFSNIPTSYEDFADEQLLRGEDTLYGPDGKAHKSLKPLFDFAEQRQLTVSAGIAASAAPGAPTQHKDYVGLRDEILDALQQAMPVSAVFLLLHGAMISTECLDCEGDLLERVRDIVGKDIPVGAVLDPHAHLTDQMVENADILSFMKEYPHTDGIERSADVLTILGDMLDGRVKPTPAVFDCRLMGFFPTQDQPMRGFVDGLFEMERQDKVLNISCVHGFPWGDMPDAGTKILVYTDNDRPLAQTMAAEIHERLWRIKDETMPSLISVEKALALMDKPGDTSNDGPLVLADIADNPGGGAPSDSTFILRAALEAGKENVAIGLIYDPQAARACHQVGVGGKLELRIGGKVSRFSGDPLDLEVEVVAVAQDAMMNVLDLVEFPMGDTAWVRAGGIDIVLASNRVQMYSPSGFTHLGLDPASKNALIVKSSNHFQAFFKDMARRIEYVSTPGAINLDLAQVTYRVFDKPFYPRVADPFA